MLPDKRQAAALERLLREQEPLQAPAPVELPSLSSVVAALTQQTESVVRQSAVVPGRVNTRVYHEDAPLDYEQVDELFTTHLTRGFATAHSE